MEQLATDEDLRVDLRARSLRRVEHFRWEKTAKETYEVYRSAVLQPSARSLSMRRRLREAILSWSEPLAEPQETGNLVSYHPVVVSEPLGFAQPGTPSTQRSREGPSRDEAAFPITQRGSA